MPDVYLTLNLPNVLSKGGKMITSSWIKNQSYKTFFQLQLML